MISIDESACPKNHACPAVAVCPVDAIVQDSIYEAPRIDQETCIDCGACSSMCRTFVQTEDHEPVTAGV